MIFEETLLTVQSVTGWTLDIKQTENELSIHFRRNAGLSQPFLWPKVDNPASPVDKASKNCSTSFGTPLQDRFIAGNGEPALLLGWTPGLEWRAK